jgi:hypothetical protein
MLTITGVLLAARFDWLEGLLPLVFVLIWVVSQVMSVFRKAAGGDAGRRAAPPARPPRRPPAAAGEVADNRPGELDREIEEFLRRSLGDPRHRKPVPPSPAPSPAAKPPKQKPRPQRPTTAGGPPRVPPVPSVPPQRPQGGDITRHVESAFAHDLAHESPTSEPAPPPALVSPATDLAATFRSPAGLRQLVLMREILERPVHRWDR